MIKQEGYVVSCVPYVKPRTMKEELNGLFLAKHGDWLEDREVALSRIYVYTHKHVIRVCLVCQAWRLARGPRGGPIEYIRMYT